MSGPATVTVRGEAAIRTAPDEAILWITLSAVRESPGKALEDVGLRGESLVAVLDEMGVKEADRTTAGVWVQEEFDHSSRGGRELGHRASARVVLRADDAELMRNVIFRSSEELRAGIDGPHWYVSPAHPARLKAAKQAAIAARDKAEAYAAGVNATLGRLIRLVDPTTAAKPDSTSVALGDRDQPIEIEEHEVRAFVDAEFALETVAAS